MNLRLFVLSLYIFGSLCFLVGSVVSLFVKEPRCEHVRPVVPPPSETPQFKDAPLEEPVT